MADPYVYLGASVLRNLAGLRDADVLAILVVFALSLASAALSVAWLATGGGGGALYGAVLWTFFSVLALSFVMAIGTTYLVVLT